MQRSSDARTDARVSVAEAARRLTQAGDRIERSALSRYIAKHADALRPVRQGKETVVDYNALAEHRRRNIGRTDELPPEAERPRAAATPLPANNRSRADETAAKLRVQRELLELNLAERRALLTPVAEVHGAAHAAIGAMQAALAQAASDTAEALAAELKVDDRAVRPHLRKLERIALGAFVGELDKLGSEPPGAD